MSERSNAAVVEPEAQNNARFSETKQQKLVEEFDFEAMAPEEATDLRNRFNQKMEPWTQTLQNHGRRDVNETLSNLRPELAELFLNENMPDPDNYSDEQKAKLARYRQTAEQVLALDDQQFTQVLDSWKDRGNEVQPVENKPEMSADLPEELPIAAADDEVMRIKKEYPNVSASERAIYWSFLTSAEYEQMNEEDFQKFEAEAADDIKKRSAEKGDTRKLIDIDAEFGSDEAETKAPQNSLIDIEAEFGVDDNDKTQELPVVSEGRNEKPKYKLFDRLTPSYWMARMQARKVKFESETSVEDQKFYKTLRNRVVGAVALAAAAAVTIGAAKGYLAGDEHAHFVNAGHDLAPHGLGLQEAQGSGISDHQAQIMDHVPSGAAPEHIFHNLGKSDEWLNQHASTLVKNFPTDFYRGEAGDLRLSHSGALSDAAQRYLVSH